MHQPIAPATDLHNTVTLLSVTPYEKDQLWLQNIVSHSKWKLYGADRLESALAVLHEHDVGVVLSERICRLIRGPICYTRYVGSKVHRK
jgi:hypothetical protein